ncbi:MAG: YraN family protein [Cellvibrionales bacterium]|nr:YraN family protein [Porticoccaceae bacterium]|tara:strand:+ start:29781 stop:30155 length:375 start_codon:yes stop_codon:yes gene_type:complete
MPSRQPPRLSGKQAEKMACNYLLKRGLTLVERNFRTRRGEIDLIMYDRQDLVFVEVKYRHSNRFGSAEEAITGAKLTRLRAAASAFLQQRQPSSQAFRLDALTLVPLVDSRHSYRYNWIKNISQ